MWKHHGVTFRSAPTIRRRVIACVITMVGIATTAATVATTGCSSTTDHEAPLAAADRGSTKEFDRGTLKVWVHFPAGYRADAADRYPVVYLVHGAKADGMQWLDIGAADQADRLAAQHRIGKVILVMPDFGDAPSAREASMLTDEIIPWADATFRTVPLRAERAVGGISRGGAAAILAAELRPDLFVAVGAHSPTITPDNKRLKRYLSSLSGNIRLDAGADDELRTGTKQFARELKATDIAAKVHVRPGDHSRSYWRSQMADYLLFYAGRWARR